MKLKVFLLSNLKKILFASFAILLILSGVLLLLNQKKQTNSLSSNQNHNQSQNSSAVLKGVTLSPSSYTGTDFPNFFVKAKEAGSVVAWSGDWKDLGNLNNGGATVVNSLASTYSYKPIFIAQFFTQSTGKLFRPLDSSAQEEYKNDAVAFAKKYKPDYLGFGIEVNLLAKKSPVDFNTFVNLFKQVYDSVKKVSQNTKIFTVFQLEKLKGLNGGLFGGANDTSNNQWSLLDQFSQADLFAFTTYPSLIYKTPDQIPDDYYTEINKHTTKPIAFTEMGWPSENVATGWNSNESTQAEFVTRFFVLTKGLKPELTIWSFLYDQNVQQPFTSMGLIDKNGGEKPAYKIWKNAS